MMEVFDILMFTLVYGAIGFGVYMFIDLIARFDDKVTHLVNKNRELTTRVAELIATNEALVNEKQSTENSSLFKEIA